MTQSYYQQSNITSICADKNKSTLFLRIPCDSIMVITLADTRFVNVVFDRKNGQNIIFLVRKYDLS